MKLRTQFVLLVAGIIAVPFVVATATLFMRAAVERGHEPLPNYAAMNAWVRRAPRTLTGIGAAAVAKGRPAGLDFVVLDAADRVTFSTVPAIAVGTPAFSETGAFLAYMRANLDTSHFQVESVPAEDGTPSLVIMQVPRLRPEIRTARSNFLGIITWTSVALLVFSSAMAFFILRSLNGSIRGLEGATRRIAGGDLDFELPAKGNDAIASLTRSFDSMRGALKEEYARRARFIMGVSHDLRTPLTLIQGYVEAIADGFAAEPEAQRRYLSIILDKARALEGMVGDLIEFVRMDTGQWRMTHHDVPLQAFLADAVHRFGEDALILRRSFDSAIDLPAGLTVRMDAALVTRALENVIGNAIRYTQESGRITFTARQEGPGAVVVDISDTGIGIPVEDLPRIFDAFYRGTNSRREQGFGLGLTTVKSIIEGHGWAISATSEPGRGTTFTIRIPLAQDPAAPVPPAARPSA